MGQTIRDIAAILSAKLIEGAPSFAITHISIDSRSLQNGASSLFFAISGPNNDAHKFLREVYNQGVRNFVVAAIPEHITDANFIVVADPKDTLQKLAAAHRAKFDFPIIGITGSNGKTIVKEWLNFLLSPEYNIIRSPKSYNSQVGVPLSVLGINEQHNLGIFEAGISLPGEMEKLEKIIRPTIGILTNIGSAHSEGFSGNDRKRDEKLLLFSNCQTVIFKKDYAPDNFSQNGFSWSFDNLAADVLITATTGEKLTTLNAEWLDRNITAEIPFADSASVENAATCLVMMLHLGYDQTAIASRMQELFPVEMRLKVKNGIANTSLIDDSYSSDFQSLRIALDFLESQKQHKRKTVILSDIFQSGLPLEKLYHDVSQMLESNKVSRVVGIGPQITAHKNAFANIDTYDSTESFLDALPGVEFANETILVKGARDFRFEQIVSALEEKTHETVLEINLNAVSHNLNYFRSKLGPGVKLMAMVKAFGYGSGGFEIARLLEHHKADYLGVAFADEGIALRTAGIKLPIMVLNPESTSFAAIVQNSLEPEIYGMRGLLAFIKIAEDRKLEHYPIHIKLDTGMHRLGFQQGNISELLEILHAAKSVKVKSVLSHMATSDEPQHKAFALEQIGLFDQMSSQIIRELNIQPIRHILNTSGISNFPDAQFDMVRLGIGLYGISNDPAEQPMLENVGTLKSVISQLRTIPAGESVGYGRRFIAQRETIVATIPIGYADGISRHWGNGLGYLVIANQKAPIIGSICMDMLMVDATGIACREGDTVIIFGEHPTVVEMAEKLNTIPYEIVTGISQRVKRIFFRD